MQKVAVKVWPQQMCVDTYKNVNDVADGMLCAGWPEGGRSVCQVHHLTKRSLTNRTGNTLTSKFIG